MKGDPSWPWVIMYDSTWSLSMIWLADNWIGNDVPSSEEKVDNGESVPDAKMTEWTSLETHLKTILGVRQMISMQSSFSLPSPSWNAILKIHVLKL